METQTLQALSPELEIAVANYSPLAQDRFHTLRSLIWSVAQLRPETDPIAETLKWGEPSFSTVRPRTGTAIRLAWKPKTPDTIGVFVNCQTSLVDQWRDQHPRLQFIGNREIRIPLAEPLPEPELKSCMLDALTYYLRK